MTEMSNECNAVLVQVVSIQKYIFSSNKLKENIGASYILEKLLFGHNGLLYNTLRGFSFAPFELEDWGKAISGGKFEIGYIGGGNALILFNMVDDAKDFIKNFSLNSILYFPGLQLAFGIKENFVKDNYKYEFHILLENLRSGKSGYIPLTSVFKHGITADCPLSNESAEVKDIKSGQYISRVSYSKFLAAIHAQKNQFTTYEELGDDYQLTDETDKLGQEDEASYIAVVHVDGNGMGKVFANIESLDELRLKSKAVSAKASSAMKSLIGHLVKLHKDNMLDELDLKMTDKKFILPIRPILVGGDDITFICEGRIGIYLAEKFIEYFYDTDERSKPYDSPKKLMDGACAGIAIVKSHFPFYKAVQLAEELCSEAKKQAREEKGTSWISFYYSATTFSGNLEELRQRTHSSPHGSLYFGPYELFNSTSEKSMKVLKDSILYFKSKWPTNKVMALREVIADTKGAIQLFEKEMQEIEHELPQKKSIWVNEETPFFDQIELKDFYLNSLLNATSDENNN
jgi:hypothetical protein